jgi:hypothetical protein
VISSDSVGMGRASHQNLLTVSDHANGAGRGFWGAFFDSRLSPAYGGCRSDLDEILKPNPIVHRYQEENALGVKDNEDI